MLFDENIGFFNFSLPIEDLKFKKEKISNFETGFLRGNMFNDIYKPYKNYTYRKMVGENKREDMLLEITKLSFVLNDLNLYLDLHESDREMLEIFKNVAERLMKLELEYVECFGPLEVNENKSLSKFEWIDNPWPWQNTGGTKYV